LNNAIAAGKGFGRVLADMEPLGLSFAKGTFLRHKGHVTDPLITAAEAARKNPVIKPTSNRAVLEMIRDLGMQKAMEDPDAINVNHALKAAKILQDAEGKQETVMVLLAKAVQGPIPELIEGNFKELTTTEEA
jgi:hypothetical protein